MAVVLAAVAGIALLNHRAEVRGRAAIEELKQQYYFHSIEALRALCPVGHRLPFIMGRTVVYVDLRWISLPPLREVWQHFHGACPSADTSPMPTILLVLDEGSPDLRKVYMAKNLPLWHLRLALNAEPNRLWHQNYIEKFSAQSRRTLPNGAVVEDILASWQQQFSTETRDRGIAHSERVYRFTHGSTDALAGEAKFVFSCSGTEGRYCKASYYYGQELDLSYYISLPAGFHLPRQGKVLSQPISEPGGLLELDVRVRALIADMMRESIPAPRYRPPDTSRIAPVT